MKLLFYLFPFFFTLPAVSQEQVFGSAITAPGDSSKTEILLLGSAHLSQLYEEGKPNTDVFSAARQQEIKQVISLLKEFQPDMIMVEELPEAQAQLDSLYRSFRGNEISLRELPDGRSEIYQIAFNLGKELQHERIWGVNAPGGTSISILDNGENIELFKKEVGRLRATAVKESDEQMENGSMSMREYLFFLNKPETVQLTHHLRYIAPARVRDGTFTNPDEMVDTAFINPKYIGAELTAVFKNRDYKIYSNIVTTQLKEQPERILLVIGQGHVGSLQSIFRDDPAYTLIHANTFLKK